MGRYATAREGGYAGGKPPLGYKAVDGKLVIVPEEAEIVRLIFTLRSQGNTLKGIAEELNKRGYRSKKGIAVLFMSEGGEQYSFIAKLNPIYEITAVYHHYWSREEKANESA